MDSVGRYRIVRRLGEGGMGVVYEAHDDRLDRTVAVKLMRDAVLGPASIERFWREARAAASISHPTSARSSSSVKTPDVRSSSWNGCPAKRWPRD